MENKKTKQVYALKEMSKSKWDAQMHLIPIMSRTHTHSTFLQSFWNACLAQAPWAPALLKQCCVFRFCIFFFFIHHLFAWNKLIYLLASKHAAVFWWHSQTACPDSNNKKIITLCTPLLAFQGYLKEKRKFSNEWEVAARSAQSQVLDLHSWLQGTAP